MDPNTIAQGTGSAGTTRVRVAGGSQAPPSLSGALLPPRPARPAQGQAAAPAARGAAAGARPPAAAAGQAAGEEGLSEILGDEPILVVEALPNGESLFDRTQAPFHARSLSIRYDTAGVGAFVGAILLGVAFMLGRTGASADAAGAQAARPLEVAAAAAAAAVAEAEPALSAGLRAAPALPALSTSAPFGVDEAAPPAVAGQPPAAPAAALAPAFTTAPASAAAPGARSVTAPEARWGIMTIGGLPERNATDVARFFEEKGYKATVVGSGHNHGVIVGAHADKRSDEFETELKAVRSLAYKDGKKAFAGAYAYPLRRGR